jgi:hypothetical protein
VTLRSAGVPPRPTPSRLAAWATYDQIHEGLACVEVVYLGAPQLWSGLRVEIRNPRRGVDGSDPLYEAAYNLACAAARVHGYDVERFARVAPGRTV